MRTAAAFGSAARNGRPGLSSRGRRSSPAHGSKLRRSRARPRSYSNRGFSMVALIVVLVVAAFVLITLARTIRIVPQARAGVIERLGRYSRTLNAGLAIVIPFVDRARGMTDLREQVVSFASQAVVTDDDLVVSIVTVS